MPRIACLMFFVLASSVLFAGGEPQVDLAGIDRTILKEPEFRSQPRYALLVIGQQAEHRAWFVVDGDEVAYVDRNGNGDLTEPGERIELDREATDKIRLGGSAAYKAMHIFPMGDVAGSQLSFRLWVPNLDFDPTQETAESPAEIRDHIRDMRRRGWLNGSLMRAAADGMQCQTPLALTTKPDDAQVCHLQGPLSFRLKWGARQQLEPWPKKSVFDLNLGTRGLPPRDWTRPGFDFSPLTTSEVPANLQPVAMLTFPTRGPDQEPLRREIILDQRCCGDTLYAIFTVPKDAAPGNATIAVNFPIWIGHDVEPAVFDVPINSELSRYGEMAFILFHDPAIGLKETANLLRKRNFDVSIQEDVLLIGNPDERPGIGIRLNRSPDALETARGLADGSAVADALRDCDACFEVGPYQAETAATLAAVADALRELTGGFMYQTWDRQLSGPR